MSLRVSLRQSIKPINIGLKSFWACKNAHFGQKWYQPLADSIRVHDWTADLDGN